MRFFIGRILCWFVDPVQQNRRYQLIRETDRAVRAEAANVAKMVDEKIAAANEQQMSDLQRNFGDLHSAYGRLYG